MRTYVYGRRQSRFRRYGHAIVLYGIAMTFLIAGIYVLVSGMQANRDAKQQAARLEQQANEGGEADGGNPSTDKPTDSAIDNYTVGATMPRVIEIPSLGVKSRVKAVGVDTKSNVETPNNIYDSGWYNGSALPGQPGAMLIDGHVSSWSQHGVFYVLKKLSQGDSILIERGDGAKLTYKVVRTQEFPADSVDMKSLLSPVTEGKQGLNLITCSGKVIPGTNSFDKRFAVYAERVDEQ